MKRLILLFFLVLVLVSCSNQQHPEISFYYWKTIFNLSSTEQGLLRENNVSKVYLRYFDVALDMQTGKPRPLAPVQFVTAPQSLKIVPVVFIKNAVMLQKGLDVEQLATAVLEMVNQINSSQKIECTEIQIDCDWSLNSKENYLQFISEFKAKAAKEVSATIRLHQIKYFKKTKIPAVDHGVLMYYNMGTIAANSSNSIYDRGVANKYLKSLKKYPLPLKVALPIFSWGVHIRENKVLGLRSKISESSLKTNVNFEKIAPNVFRVINSNYKNGVYYEAGDQIKIEEISEINLKEMASDLSDNLPRKPSEIIFYDLDEFNINNHEKNIFKQIVSYF